MKAKRIISYFIILIFVVTFGISTSFWFFSKEKEDTLNNALFLHQKNLLHLIVGQVYGDLIIENRMEAERKLNLLIKKNIISSFNIHKEISNSHKNDLCEEIYFDQDNMQGHWGSLCINFSSKNFHQNSLNFNGINGVIIFLSCFFLLIILFIFKKASTYNNKLFQGVDLALRSPEEIFTKTDLWDPILEQLRTEVKRKNEIEVLIIRKQIEEEKFALATQVSHDIRSPLAALNSIAENLTDNGESYRLLQNSIARINEIANKLLNNNKEGYVELPSFHSIAPLIQEIIEEKKNEYLKRGIEINFQNSSNKSALIVPSEFKRIISNLINNSIEATDLNPKIQIELLQKEDNIKLIIKDNGKGIPEKILQTLGTKAITTKTSGNGLGLKHAYSTIKEWEGSFNVIETNENGTTIEIILRADLITTAKSESPLTILIDDDALTRATWESKAKKAEIAFQSFKDIPSFKESLSTLDKNVVIYIDSELGEIKGETLAKELHEMGFLNLSIASGHPPERFKEYTFLKSVISKKAPF